MPLDAQSIEELKTWQFQVLDHGYIKVVDVMGSDETFVEAARMSTNKGFISWKPYERCDSCGKVQLMDEERKQETWRLECGPSHKMTIYPNGDLALLDNLWRNKHATPFEMCELTIEVQAPIMVFREWHRHRTQSYNEMSARYTQMPNLHYLPERGRIQKQSTSNKQGSAEAVGDGVSAQVLSELARQQDDVYETYDSWVSNGIAKEVARLNTPVSRYSRMRAKTDVRNWLAFCNLRMRPGAQWEIRQYANMIGNVIAAVWPKTWVLYEEYDLYGVHFSKKEMGALRLLLSSKFNANEAGKSVGLSGTRLEEFEKKILKGGKEIL